MRLQNLLPLLALLCATRAHAQEPRPHPVPGVRWTVEEVLASPPADALRLGLRPLSASELRALFPVPGLDPFRSARSGGDEPEPLVALAGVSEAVVPADTPVSVVPPGGGGLFRDLELPDLVEQHADLALRVEGRGELGGAWNRYRPCEPGLRLNCNPDLFPRLQPEIAFGVQVGGTISERIHVDVDYDQRREFDAANNINIYYQGLAGEVLQRVEMGDVSVDLPASRYLTQGIPSGNFGFKAAARLGETEVEAVWAQQKGAIASREFRLGGGGQAGLVQDQELVVDDAEYATGQFFFLVDPTTLAEYPHVDVLTLTRSAAPFDVRPRAEGLVVYRDEGAASAQYREQAQTGKFLADAVSADGTVRHSGLFTLLVPGQDYFVHSSGLWVALRAPLRGDEALAVAYVTESGDTVGDPAAEAAPVGEKPELRLVRGPETVHQPGQATWPYEMHQVYRLDSSAEVETSTLELVISLGHRAAGATFKQFAGRQIPLLRLFGLDDDAPADRIDGAHVFRPGSDLDGFGSEALRGTFIVFPTLEPFGRPPPVPSEGLSPTESAGVLGTDANPTIYDEPDPVIRKGASRFRLNFRYRVRLEGLPSSFNLGAFGIRQGSERITVDDRLLTRGIDYVVDYDLGLVTLLDPQSVFGTNPDAEIRATWEQKALFEIAPTTVFGLTSRSRLGPYGELALVGMYQAEQAIVRRPQLGGEPGAVLLGGASGRLAFEADWVVRALDAIPGLTVDSTARLDVTGELALSAPEPNRAGATYLDDFEAADQTPLSLDAAEWRLGSAPQNPDGIGDLAWPYTVDNAVRTVWQDRYLADGREVGFLTASEIDEQIALAGAQLAERVLYLTMGQEAGTVVPPPQWRSITTVLSTTGRDLSRAEYLEFYAAPLGSSMEGATLILDVGAVSEDAFYFDETGALEGTIGGVRPWGRGVLDEEARLALREVWGPVQDARGLWDESCEADRRPVPLGDPRANCTVNNGRPDSEDLNANGVLDDLDGPHFRYVVRLDGTSPYLVRDENATGSPLGFRLFRIPLRGPNGLAVQNASDATWRFVKHLRLTVVKPTTSTGTLALARLRIGGSRWTKRLIHGIMDGPIGEQPGSGSATAQLRVSPVSRLTDGSAYVSPPGVEDEPQDPKSTIGASGVEFNEKSLRLSWESLPADERAEVYYRYPQQPRSFLEYRALRLWAVARSGSWGPQGDHRLQVRLGTDERNYYLYQTRLNPPSAGGVSEGDWLPERVIDFEVWLGLKAEAERLLIEAGGAAAPLVVWSPDSTYAVVMQDRARAPNLAAVRELGFAVYNAGAADGAGEVWLDDLRLDAGARDAGFAGRVDVDLAAGGFLSASASFGGRGGRFRQLDDVASYQADDELMVNATAELGRFAPASWGLAMPLTMSYARRSLDPLFLQGTDVRADRLEGLRDAGSSRRRIGLALRKTTPSSNPLVSALVDGTSLRLGYVTARDATVTTASRISGIDAGVDVDRRVGTVDLDVIPGFLETLLRWLAPRRVEESVFFDRLAGTRLRLTPERVGMSLAYASQDERVWRYERPLATPGDDEVAPLLAPRRGLEGTARVTLRPFESLTAQVGLLSGRDLLEPSRATSLTLEQQALHNARSDLAGVPIGWERDRAVSTDISYRPRIADWLRPSFGWNSRFGQRRDPAYLDISDTPDGQRATLLRTFNADRRINRGLVVDPGGAARALLNASPDASPWEHGVPLGALLWALRPIKPVELTWTDELGSRFDRDAAEPDWDYQLGWGTLDAFRAIGGDTAATVVRRDGFRARSGFRLGPTASLDVSYGETDLDAFDRAVGRRDQLERSWPDVQVSWQDIPVPGFFGLFIERWSFSTGFVHTERATTLGAFDPRLRGQDEATVPVELRLSFPGDVALSYIGAFTDGDGRDPTGTTTQGALTHGIDLTGRFRPPGPLRGRFPEPFRLSLAYDYQAQRQCRKASGSAPATPCTPFVDFLNRRMNLTLSTLVSQIDLGLQVSYVDRRNFIGIQAGSSQFQLGLFGQFSIQAGTF